MPLIHHHAHPSSCCHPLRELPCRIVVVPSPAAAADCRCLLPLPSEADDIADEGDALAPQRLETLRAYRQELHAIAGGAQPQARWATIFGPLQYNLLQHHLPVTLLDDLLSAFSARH